jgi:hypothetical protein
MAAFEQAPPSYAPTRPRYEGIDVSEVKRRFDQQQPPVTTIRQQQQRPIRSPIPVNRPMATVKRPWPPQETSRLYEQRGQEPWPQRRLPQQQIRPPPVPDFSYNRPVPKESYNINMRDRIADLEGAFRTGPVPPNPSYRRPKDIGPPPPPPPSSPGARPIAPASRHIGDEPFEMRNVGDASVHQLANFRPNRPAVPPRSSLMSAPEAPPEFINVRRRAAEFGERLHGGGGQYTGGFRLPPRQNPSQQLEQRDKEQLLYQRIQECKQEMRDEGYNIDQLVQLLGEKRVTGPQLLAISEMLGDLNNLPDFFAEIKRALMKRIVYGQIKDIYEMAVHKDFIGKLHGDGRRSEFLPGYPADDVPGLHRPYWRGLCAACPDKTDKFNKFCAQL